MNVFDNSWRVPSPAELAWFDSLPPGTFVTAEALRRFVWPVDPQRLDRWLLVRCTRDFNYRQYVRWLEALPGVGIVVDPSDERHRRFVFDALEVVPH